jgi:hypothetical protein
VIRVIFRWLIEWYGRKKAAKVSRTLLSAYFCAPNKGIPNPGF